MTQRMIALVLVCFLSSTAVWGEPKQRSAEAPSALQAPPPSSASISSRCGTLEAPRCSLFLLPVASLLLPGLGQYVDGRAGWPYTVVAVGGLGGAVAAISQVTTPAELAGFTSTNAQLAGVLGTAWQTSAFLSAYETYRARMVEDLSLPSRLSPIGEVLLAPVRFDRVVRPSVFLPLLVSVGLGALDVTRAVDSRPVFGAYRPLDAPFTAGISYGAGTGEEALFRGFLMSYMNHRWSWNRWVANGVQAVAFGAAHMDFRPFPLGVRTALGGYLGWVTQQNDYELTDAIFIHTWWDVIQLTTYFATVSQGERATAFINLPPIPF